MTDRMAATRASYNAVAGSYAEAMSDELRHKPPYPDAEVPTPRAYFLARARGACFS